MNTIMLCVLNSEKLASALGKKGTESDITLYNHKKGETALSVAVPTRYPDRLAPLLYSLYMGDEVIMVVDRLDKQIGEMLVACDVTDKRKGQIILENYIGQDQVKPLLKDTALEGWTITEGMGDPNVMREAIMERRPVPRDGATRVTVDHSFNVKGLGTVVLGVVDRGIVRKHQELAILPGGKKTLVRSIQMHDDDVDQAGSGSRVGLALKNAEPEDAGRGCVLAEEGSLSATGELKLRVKVSRFWRDTLKDGMVVHVSAGMQFVPGTVAMSGELRTGQEGEISIKLEGQMVVEQAERVVVNWLESSGPRIVGSAVTL